MKNWRMLIALCLACTLAFCFAACGAAPADPTTEPVETTAAPTEETETEYVIDPATFKDFIGKWYADGSSASYTLTINEDSTWTLVDAAGDTLFAGNLNVTEENKAITLYDPDSIQIMDLKLEEAGKLYAELYAEALQETISTNYFLNVITNSESSAPEVPDDAAESATAPAENPASSTEPEPDADPEVPSEEPESTEPVD